MKHLIIIFLVLFSLDLFAMDCSVELSRWDEINQVPVTTIVELPKVNNQTARGLADGYEYLISAFEEDLSYSIKFPGDPHWKMAGVTTLPMNDKVFSLVIYVFGGSNELICK